MFKPWSVPPKLYTRTIFNGIISITIFNGILNVSAIDKATNKEQSIRIESSSGLSEDEIEKMKRDAESHNLDK